jgi:alginate export protein
MRCLKRKIWWLAFLLFLIPAPSSALHYDFNDNDLFPKPYVYKDKEIANTKPRFTLNQSGALPDWLSLAVQHRIRYETLNSQFRSGTTGSDQALSLRTLAQATVRLHPNFKIQLELQDSRAELADSGTAMTPGIVNAAELLEANLQWLAKGLFQEDSRSLLRGGRLTIDIGKRRLVSRNRFRNTINAFTGVDWIWKAKSGNTVRTFFTLPVNRQPFIPAELLENDASFDEETLDRIFWGVFFSTPSLPWGDKGEFYLFGLHEDDRPDFLTRNRQLYTPGFRLYRPAQKGRLDYEWESIFQFGRSRATFAATDTRDLDHFAHFHHAEVGYSFTAPWSPRLILAYDYASGDADPNDGTHGRFDPLFGATVFDFSPTGIHRPFIRSNVTGPGLIFSIHPHKRVSTYIHYRAFWLASKKDIWAGNSVLQDTTGGSGSFLGQQWFVRAKWQVLANVQLEGGVAYRIDGDFQGTAPNSPREGNTLYSYIQTTLMF